MWLVIKLDKTRLLHEHVAHSELAGLLNMVVRVAFIHPDLGIGGAERLVVDAAMALKSHKHEVEIYTAHHDPGHCFAETKDGRLNVYCAGDWLPRHFLHKGYALFAYLRMIYVALYLVFFSRRHYDVIFCDQISACIPVLQCSRAKIVFYCHFPDQLLTKRRSLLKRLYRWPIDTLEEWTTGLADVVLVNSGFTADVFHKTFHSLNHIKPSILYPSLNFMAFDKPPISLGETIPNIPTTIFLSINRYERKKNLSLAITAFAKMLETCSSQESVHLVMAGGYDERVVENREYYDELVQLAEKLGVRQKVTFLRSFSDEEKVALLDRCAVLVYTPSNEHFGICPLEAMYMKRPVIAVNSGGPLETVVEGETGFLCDPTTDAFAGRMEYFMEHSSASEKMGDACRRHVLANFSFASFTDKLNDILYSLQRQGERKSRPGCLLLVISLIMCSTAILWYLLL